VRVAEYYDIDTKKKTVYLLSDGTTSETNKNLPEGITVVKKKTAKVKTVTWYKLSPFEVLDKKEVVFNRIPVVPVTGTELNVQGRKTFISLTRFAKDPQRMINYWKSCFTEIVALQPRAPYVGAAGQFAGYEQLWKASARKNIAYLEYNPISSNGQMQGAPQRQYPNTNPTGVVEGIRDSVDDFKAATMIFDASLGANGNETSGRAINARKMQGEIGNFHFFDNLSRSIRSAFKLIVDAIPDIYDTDRAIRILGEDMKEKIVRLSQSMHDPKQKIYNLDTGRYDVVIESGPTYMTAKEAAADHMMQMIQGNPNIAMNIPDLMAKYLDMPAEMVERLQKTLPPGLLTDPNNPQTQQDPRLVQQAQQSQMMVQQMDQVIQKMDAEIQQLQQAVKDKEADRQANIAKVVIKAKADVEKAQVEHGQDMERMAVEHAHDVGSQAAQAHVQQQQILPDVLQQLVDSVNNISARLTSLEGGESGPASAQSAG
jgi:hypothetical protein